MAGWLVSQQTVSLKPTVRSALVEGSVNMDTSNGDSPGNFNANNSHSSPENSPRTEINQMDTSVELNGLKNVDNRTSQQFCLRWNNHQVRRSFKSPFKSIRVDRPAKLKFSFDGHRQLHFNLHSDPDFIAKNFSTLAVTECSCCSKKNLKEKKSATDFSLKRKRGEEEEKKSEEFYKPIARTT